MNSAVVEEAADSAIQMVIGVSLIQFFAILLTHNTGLAVGVGWACWAHLHNQTSVFNYLYFSGIRVLAFSKGKIKISVTV